MAFLVYKILGCEPQRCKGGAEITEKENQRENIEPQRRQEDAEITEKENQRENIALIEPQRRQEDAEFAKYMKNPSAFLAKVLSALRVK